MLMRDLCLCAPLPASSAQLDWVVPLLFDDEEEEEVSSGGEGKRKKKGKQEAAEKRLHRADMFEKCDLEVGDAALV